MRSILRAKSSSGDPYDVTFEFDGGVLSVQCSCKAGIMHSLCKHRTAFVKCDASMLYDSADAEELGKVAAWVQQTDFPSLFAQLDEAEAAVSRAQHRVKQVKKRIETAMSAGLGRSPD